MEYISRKGRRYAVVAELTVPYAVWIYRMYGASPTPAELADVCVSHLRVLFKARNEVLEAGGVDHEEKRACLRAIDRAMDLNARNARADFAPNDLNAALRAYAVTA